MAFRPFRIGRIPPWASYLRDDLEATGWRGRGSLTGADGQNANELRGLVQIEAVRTAADDYDWAEARAGHGGTNWLDGNFDQVALEARELAGNRLLQ